MRGLQRTSDNKWNNNDIPEPQTPSQSASDQVEGDYLTSFERNNEIYTLKSQLNQAHLAIEKMALQQEQQLMEEKEFYKQI